MIVFERERPVRRERVFAADADHAAPPRFTAPIRDKAGRLPAESRGQEAVVFIVCDGSAALHVKQKGVPGISNLPGEQTDGVDPAAIGNSGAGKKYILRNVRAAQI